MICPQCRDDMEHQGGALFEGVLCDAYRCPECDGVFLDPGPKP